MADLISVIVTTHERPDALDAVLRSLARQNDRDFEIVVADDGSGPATAQTIAAWQSRSAIPIRHAWHEHRGFRAGEIRNRAIAASHGGYCIFLDGDCIARPDFIARHRALAERDWFVTGNRILMSQDLTARVLKEGLEPETWSFADWIGRRLHRGINRLAPMLALALGPLRKLRPSQWRHARSCNLAIWRDDLDRVDGFDADYNGWGREDSDLLVRLLHAGVRRKDGFYATGVLHLWHPAADRSALTANDQKLERVLAEKPVRARIGLSRLKSVPVAPEAQTSSRRPPAPAALTGNAR
jgi:glycosyltransferase involved in cell wall biosynthesis